MARIHVARMFPSFEKTKGMDMTIALRNEFLPDDILSRCGRRAAGYDRENAFFADDFEELRDAGFLKINIPTEFGGQGMSLSEMGHQLRRLAYHAPATALAINMHLYWIGIAADMRRFGDPSLEWVLREAAAGEIFAAGHAEIGNDLPALLSTTHAKRVDGGYLFTGHKMFGSLTPVWTRFGIHGMDTSNPQAPKTVHAFLPKGTVNVEVRKTWDTLGMRATCSEDTILDGAFVPDKYIARVLPAGEIDPFVGALFANALVGIANVYFGVALRARTLAVASTQKKKCLAITRTMAYHPEFQHAAAEMTMAIDAMEAHLDRVADDWSAGVDHGEQWGARIVAMKHHVVESAKKVVDVAMDMSGGGGFFRTNELERLYRDVRAGGFHPANSALTHEIVGKTTLGVPLGETPRWG
jgi:alkylation response protein AidB-like acyl-CoA dehydrogenase